jgi:hypothetical protein
MLDRMAEALRNLLEEAEELHNEYNYHRESDGWDPHNEDDSLSVARQLLSEYDHQREGR